MPLIILATVLLVLTVAGFYIGRRRSVALAGGRPHRLHSLPGHYGLYVAMWCGFPAAMVLVLWLSLEPAMLERLVIGSLPDELRALDPQRLDLVMNEVRNIADGTFSTRSSDVAVSAAAEHYNRLQATGYMALTVVVLALAIAGLSFGWRRVLRGARSRAVLRHHPGR